MHGLEYACHCLCDSFGNNLYMSRLWYLLCSFIIIFFFSCDLNWAIRMQGFSILGQLYSLLIFITNFFFFFIFWFDLLFLLYPYIITFYFKRVTNFKKISSIIIFFLHYVVEILYKFVAFFGKLGPALNQQRAMVKRNKFNLTVYTPWIVMHRETELYLRLFNYFLTFCSRVQFLFSDSRSFPFIYSDLGFSFWTLS